MGGTRFMVQWEEHPSHLATRLGQLLEHQTLVDVTLMCNTHTLRVHRAVLAACSPYFETILQRQLGMYPLIVLKDMQFSVLKSLIEFMYCGETSVTEDNLSALLQAAKFFQVKGLSAMTKEALGLTSTTPKPPTVNGDSARKAFVGRSKRVGMHQTFVASGLKTLPSTTHAAGSHGGEVFTPTTGKTIFQTTPKSVPVRQDTHHQQQQQQQQTDTAQLLLSLSGGEFPKQTFHTVSKNVRFHHNVSQGSAVTVEPARSCPLDSSIVKNKETAVRPAEVIDRVPVVTPNGGVKPSPVLVPDKGTAEQAAVPEKLVEAAKEDLTTSQMFFVEDGPSKRGRPLKRQMNLVFQEKVLTDAELALQKEAEASRKALEMLQQEMSTGDEAPAAGTTQTTECVQQKALPVKQQLSKIQPVNNILTTTPRLMPKDPLSNTKLVSAKTNITPQTTTVSAPETSNQNVIYQVAGNTISGIDPGNSETNIVYQLPEGVIQGQDSGNATNIVYQVADNTVVAGQDSNTQNIIYQVADNASTSAEGASNTNIIYQVTDNSNAGTGSAMSQYMEVLKEAGLPSDVPILLESADGSYVTVNEEVLMNIMNGGMIQVGDGSIVGGEGVQFIVQEVQEVNEGQVEAAATPAEQPMSADNATDQTLEHADEQMEVTEENNAVEEQKVVETVEDIKQGLSGPGVKIETKHLPSLDNEAEAMEVAQDETVSDKTYLQESKEHIEKVDKSKIVDESSPMEADISDVVPSLPSEEPSVPSDEIITGDTYGEEAMEGFAVLETPTAEEAEKTEYTESSGNDFVFPEQTSSSATAEATCTLENKKSKESKLEEVPANGGMSVEQALQAMMGEGSDTEMEVCANTGTDGTTKVKPVVSHRDTKGRTTPNEGSIDEETEDLRLVLSPEDESIKVEDESQSAGEGSLNDSFTLALSSPDSSGNEKAQLEAENLAESAEGTQKPVTEIQSSAMKEETNSEDFTCSAPRSADILGGETFPSESVSVGTPENSNSVEINESEVSEPSKQLLNNEVDTLDMEMNNSIPLTCDSVTVTETEPHSTESEALVADKTEISEAENISEKADETAKELPSLGSPSPQPQTDGNGSEDALSATNEDSSTSNETSIAARDINIDSDCSTLPAPDNEFGKSLPIISLCDTNTSKETEDKTDAFSELTIISSNLVAVETEIENNTDNERLEKTETNSLNTPASQSFDTTDSVDSKPHTESSSLMEPGINVESVQESNSELSVSGCLESELPASVSADRSVTDEEKDKMSVSEATDMGLVSEANDEGKDAVKSCEENDDALKGVESGDRNREEDEQNALKAVESGDGNLEENEENILKDTESGDRNREENEENVLKDTESEDRNREENEENPLKDVESIDMKDGMMEVKVDLEMVSDKANTDENGLEPSKDGGEGTVASPSKDIPYAVGLLPLKTALEKLQAMPEYHPRKTRSASSGKEGSSDVPAGRLKRKASSSADGSEKKMKPSDAEDGDASFETESVGAIASEDFDEGQTLEGSVVDENSKNRLQSPPPPEEPMETVAVGRVEALPSMMELVSDSDAV